MKEEVGAARNEARRCHGGLAQITWPPTPCWRPSTFVSCHIYPSRPPAADRRAAAPQTAALFAAAIRRSSASPSPALRRAMSS